MTQLSVCLSRSTRGLSSNCGIEASVEATSDCLSQAIAQRARPQQPHSLFAPSPWLLAKTWPVPPLHNAGGQSVAAGPIGAGIYT